MSDRECTRRRALRLGSAGLAAGLAGCGGMLGEGSNGDSDDGTNPLDAVPAGAAMVAHIEVGQLLDGPVVRRGVERALSLMTEQRPGFEGPESYEDALSMVEDEFGLDPKGADAVTVFFAGGGDSGDGTASPSGSPAAIVDADWSEDEVIGALGSDDAPLDEREYGDATLYKAPQSRPRTNALGALADGRFVTGPTPVVEEVVDVVAGEAPTVGSDVTTLYERAPEGPVRFAADLDSLPGERSGPMAGIETVSGGMSADGDRRTLAVAIEAADETAADGVRAAVEGGLRSIRNEMDSGTAVPEDLRNAVAQLREIEVSQDGATVTVSHEAGVEGTARLGMLVAAVFGTFALGFGQRSDPPRVPQAAFGFDWEATGDAGTLRITHQAGDTIDGSQLYVRGTVGDREIDREWEADYGVSEVQAGSSITIENVTGNYRIRLVWVASDGSTSTTLATNEGPDA